jgi:carbonic anhydrase/acetyltransferase-like protein (isoleucine patch superfamily)
MTIQERLGRHLRRTPSIHPSAYIAPGATVLGDVTVGKNSSIWPGAVLRGDINSIRIGANSNVQDCAVIHVADDYPAIIGDHVTVGHGAVVHACKIADKVLVGMNSTILDGAEIGKGSIIAANSLVKMGMSVPPDSLVAGVPGKVIRQLSTEEVENNKALAGKYIHVSAAHRVRAG